MRLVNVVAVAALALGALGLGACAKRSTSDRDREPPESVTRTRDPESAIDSKLMLALSQAKNLHHKAKVYTSDGNTAAAIESVREILSLSFPPNAPEAEDVRNDARALLARLLVGQGQLDAAMHVVTEGLGQSQRESFFVANLHTVQGEILEEQAKAADATDKPRATELRHAAIDAYDASNRIDAKLQAQLLEHP